LGSVTTESSGTTNSGFRRPPASHFDAQTLSVTLFVTGRFVAVMNGKREVVFVKPAAVR
jgi:hypothetical protein